MKIFDTEIQYIIGLGNPESKYNASLHNLGFLFVDVMLEKFSHTNIKGIKQDMFKVNISDTSLILSKPKTYMNLSGEAIKEIYKNNKKDNFIESILVVHDEITSNMFQIKYKDGKVNPGTGGHNGIRSIANGLMELGFTKESANGFKRLRLGCNSDLRNTMDLSKYILMPIKTETAEQWKKTISDWIDINIK